MCDRCGAQNIIPVSIGAAKTVDKVIPELKEKLTGMALHVPTFNMSIMVMTSCLEKAAKYKDMKEMVKQASEVPLNGILSFAEDRVVYRDFHSNTHSYTFDAGTGIALSDHCVKLIFLTQ